MEFVLTSFSFVCRLLYFAACCFRRDHQTSCYENCTCLLFSLLHFFCCIYAFHAAPLYIRHPPLAMYICLPHSDRESVWSGPVWSVATFCPAAMAFSDSWLRGMGSTLILLSLMTLSAVNCQLSCHYCGVDDNCPQPYQFGEGETPNVIQCPQSCMKFDGKTEDGFRVTVRYVIH